MCTSIVYFLAKKGYHFENSTIIEKIVNLEKKGLEKQLVETTEIKKSFKI